MPFCLPIGTWPECRPKIYPFFNTLSLCSLFEIPDSLFLSKTARTTASAIMGKEVSGGYCEVGNAKGLRVKWIWPTIVTYTVKEAMLHPLSTCILHDFRCVKWLSGWPLQTQIRSSHGHLAIPVPANFIQMRVGIWIWLLLLHTIIITMFEYVPLCWYHEHHRPVSQPASQPASHIGVAIALFIIYSRFRLN